jgi:hypothetical protein
MPRKIKAWRGIILSTIAEEYWVWGRWPGKLLLLGLAGRQPLPSVTSLKELGATAPSHKIGDIPEKHLRPWPPGGQHAAAIGATTDSRASAEISTLTATSAPTHTTTTFINL